MCIISEIVNEFVEKLLSLDLVSPGIDSFLENGKEMSTQLILDLTRERLHEIDETYANNPDMRPGWTIQKKEPRTLVSTLGDLTYTRRHYKNQTTGEHTYLTDLAADIEPYERITQEAKVAVCNAVVDHSHQGSASLVCENRISKQSVSRIVREVELPNHQICDAVCRKLLLDTNKT